tara:strand:- start:8776 stop:9810 length:1035 start_codon:yes stop_codon:yes gene_type:complete
MSSKILITGVAGFIGFHICKRLIIENQFVIGIDNLNDYYDVSLKKARLREIEVLQKNNQGKFIFIKCNLEDDEAINTIFNQHRPKIIIHLAAQAGVRYSLKNPKSYISSNLVGFGNILESCRRFEVEHLLYASSSSIYGGNEKIPFSEEDFVDSPVSLYAATKKANELMAYSYSHLYKISCTGIRFFTVYGPWGRPDMALMIFTKAILNSESIRIFNHGKMSRDFTYIDDVVEAVIRLLKKPPLGEKIIKDEIDGIEKFTAPHRVINVGNNKPVDLLRFIEILEKELGVEAKKSFEKIQLGEVEKTYADISLMKKLINFEPSTSLQEGIKNFVSWYKEFYESMN